MELKSLATKPKLQKITVDADVIVSAYGEPIDFWMWDRQDLPTYLKLAQVKDNQEELFEILKDLVLDSEGNKILDGGAVMPMEIMVPVIEKAVLHLGKHQPLTSAA